mgnify:CR=1 FL=1
MGQEMNELLTKAKDLLKGELTSISYETWIKTLEIESMTDSKIVLKANSDVQMDTINTRYHDLIVNTFAEITKKYYEISCVLESTKDSFTSNTSTSINYDVPVSSSINPNYTFETFVVGKNNSLAHAASLAVAEAPAKAYNPLFLYGGVGLGKTHLMHAVANTVLKNDKSKNVLYVTSEKFTNEIINAIKDNKTEQFRNKYRNIDVLLIDDIQFIAGKDTVQEEFFHTFNTLRENGKQIILSSDKPPRDIQLLEERLKSRFEWGLIADISAPDYETRLAILRKKASSENIVIDDEILMNIANRVDTNIRELEGALNKIIAHATLIPGPISKELAERAINDIVMKKEKIISIEFIQDTVCKYFNIDKRDLKSSNRSNDIAYPRQIAMYLCKTVAHQSFPAIGKEFGKRDHTTVMHAYNKIEKEIKDIPNTKLIVDSLKNILLNDDSF